MYTAIVTTHRTEYNRNGLLVELGAMSVAQKGFLLMEAAETYRKDDGELWQYTYTEVAVEVKARTVRELEPLMWAEYARQEAEYAGCDRTFCDYHTDARRV